MTLTVRKNHPQERTALPSPSLHLRLQIESLPLKNRVYLMLQQFLYPGSSSYGSNAYLTQLFNSFEEILKIDGPLLSRKCEIEEVFRRCAHKIIDPQRAVFTRVGVSSQPELQAKFKLVENLKKQGLALYFSTGGRKLRQNIDEEVAKASGLLNPENQAVITAYWKLRLEDPWGAENHAVLELELYELCIEKLKYLHADVESLQDPQFNYNVGFTLKRFFIKNFRLLMSKWIEARDSNQCKSIETILDYKMLKAQLFFSPILHIFLREKLEPLIAHISAKIKKSADQKKASVKSYLAYYQREIKGLQCCMDREKLKQSWDKTEEDLNAQIKVNEKYRTRCLSKISLLQNCTDDKCVRWAKQHWNFEELKQVLKDETDYDRNVIKLLKLTVMINPTEDLFLDLKSFEDPVTYFAHRFETHDKEALANFVDVKA